MTNRASPPRPIEREPHRRNKFTYVDKTIKRLMQSVCLMKNLSLVHGCRALWAEHRWTRAIRSSKFMLNTNGRATHVPTWATPGFSARNRQRPRKARRLGALLLTRTNNGGRRSTLRRTTAVLKHAASAIRYQSRRSASCPPCFIPSEGKSHAAFVGRWWHGHELPSA